MTLFQSDPYLSGSNYSLKQTQGLLIEFIQFPQQITSLLSLCLEEEHKSSPKYLLQLNLSEVSPSHTRSFATLDIIETNPFKHLTHLSLRLSSLDETSFRKYLLTNYQSLKSENEKLTRSLQLLQSDVRILTQENSGKSSQLDSLRQQFNQELSGREKSLEKRLRSLEEENKDLKSEREKDEELITRLKSEVGEKDQMLKSVEEEVIKLTDTMSSEDDIKKRILSLQGSLEQLQQSLEDKNEELIEKNNRIEILTDDLQKGHEIIRKLQNETLRAHSKLDLLNEVSSKQDLIVTEKDEKLEQLESDLKLCMQRMKKKENESEKHRKEVEKMREKLNESEEKIKTNENLICWLNKQLASLKPSPSLPPERMGACVSTGVPSGHTNGVSSRLTGTADSSKNGRGPIVGMTVSGRPIISSSSANNPSSNNHQKAEQSRFSNRNPGSSRGGDCRISSVAGGGKLNPLALSPSLPLPPVSAPSHLLPLVNLNDKHVRSSGLNHLVYSKN